MSQFEELLNKFRSACGQLNSLAEDLRGHAELAQMLDEVLIASQALGELKAAFEEKVLSIDERTTRFDGLTDEMKNSEVYGPMEPGEQEQIADYLARMNQPLATPEILIQALEASLKEKTTRELVQALPKAQIISLGQTEDPEADAYNVGFDSCLQAFEEDRIGAVALVAKMERARGFTELARDYYREVFK